MYYWVISLKLYVVYHIQNCGANDKIKKREKGGVFLPNQSQNHLMGRGFTSVIFRCVHMCSKKGLFILHFLLHSPRKAI